MILIGQYDSPFVRRAAAALHHHGHDFERQVSSTFAHFEEVRAANPLGKVPVLILEDGTALPDSRAILEYLDLEAPAGQRLLPNGPAALAVLRTEAVANGLAEKTYERGIEVNRRAPGSQDPDWMARLETQIASALDWLEPLAGPGWLVADRLSRADLALTTALTFLARKQPQLFDATRCPNLAAYRGRAEETPVFAACPYSETEARATGWRPEAEISHDM